MFLRYIPSVALAACTIYMIECSAVADVKQQPAYDQAAATRDYVQFLVLELDQWTRDFPQRFYLAAAQPPVEAAKLSEGVKASADDLANSVKQLSALSKGKSVDTPAFLEQVGKSIAAAKLLNEAFGSQRFPRALRADWDQIRTGLNELSQTYQVEAIAYLAPPEPAKGGNRQTAAAGKPGISGYIVDDACALRGKGMWTNAECIAKCVRNGDKIVLVTEEGKIYKFTNPDKIDPDTYGQKITVPGAPNGDTLTFASHQ